MIYGYARVSTREQNTARQIEAFKAEKVDKIVEEHGSGKDFENRPRYQNLRRRLKRGDTLVVMSLDRFGRNYDEILDEWRYMTKRKGVTIRVLDMPILSTPIPGLVGQFLQDIILQLLSYVAQSERERILERQRQGIAVALARGTRFGRPGVEKPDNFNDVAGLVLKGEVSIRAGASLCGVSRTLFHRWIRRIKETGNDDNQ